MQSSSLNLNSDLFFKQKIHLEMKKKNTFLCALGALVLGISFSAFIEPGEVNTLKEYKGICPNGKEIIVCGEGTKNCVPRGTCD